MLSWVNGRIVAADGTHIRPDDHGFTVGDGVFETLKVCDGQPFALDRHLARLTQSAGGLGLPAPDLATVRRATTAVLRANSGDSAVQSGRLRITYTSGIGRAGSERGTTKGTLVVSLQAGATWPPSISTAISPWPRNERSPLMGLKTTSYAENAVSLAWAKDHGHGEAILLNLQGDVCEGTGSNIFLVVGGKLITPELAAGCLPGITRELVLEWCDVTQAVVTVEQLADASEVFVTSSTRDVQPVHQIGERKLTAPGPVTADCQAVFRERSSRSANP